MIYRFPNALHAYVEGWLRETQQKHDAGWFPQVFYDGLPGEFEILLLPVDHVRPQPSTPRFTLGDLEGDEA